MTIFYSIAIDDANGSRSAIPIRESLGNSGREPFARIALRDFFQFWISFAGFYRAPRAVGAKLALDFKESVPHEVRGRATGF